MQVSWSTPKGTVIAKASVSFEPFSMKNIYTSDVHNVWMGFSTSIESKSKIVTFVLYPFFFRIWIW